MCRVGGNRGGAGSWAWQEVGKRSRTRFPDGRKTPPEKGRGATCLECLAVWQLVGIELELSRGWRDPLRTALCPRLPFRAENPGINHQLLPGEKARATECRSQTTVLLLPQEHSLKSKHFLEICTYGFCDHVRK